jgi:hypothetical protein
MNRTRTRWHLRGHLFLQIHGPPTPSVFLLSSGPLTTHNHVLYPKPLHSLSPLPEELFPQISKLPPPSFPILPVFANISWAATIGLGCSSEVEPWPSMCKVLNSILSTIKKLKSQSWRLGMVSYTYNPSYLGGRDRKISV